MQEIQGPSRVLFTIKEEEKEDLESEKSCSDRKFRTKGSYSLNDEEVVMMSMEREIESPFFTPCGSPPYYSPSSSPPREVKHLKEIDCCFVVRIDELQRKVGERDSHGD
ncbi:hypothetical protein IFM89_026018 [Coptis chinensis]|nr:hypothetical protein IFM89_026018 [Coptis chinensis]